MRLELSIRREQAIEGAAALRVQASWIPGVSVDSEPWDGWGHVREVPDNVPGLPRLIEELRGALRGRVENVGSR